MRQLATLVSFERLCLIGAHFAERQATVALKDLPRYPLVMPQREHVFRKLMESQAALAGVKLNVAWEVSSVPAILDLVRGGHGYAALTQTAIRGDSNRDPLSVIPISEPEINSTLCIAQPSQKRHTVLLTSTAAILRRRARGAIVC